MGALGQLAAAVLDERNSIFLKMDFQVKGMVAGPKEDGRFRPGKAFFLQSLQLADDELGLPFLIEAARCTEGVPLPGYGPADICCAAGRRN